MSAPFDRRDLREALGTFATGVTIVTAWDDAANEPVGVTASSFNSVSLDPPLVLWSIAKTALSAGVMTGGTPFAIHVLHAEQTKLANRFAKSGTDKFGPTDFTRADNGVPVLTHCVTRFDCSLHAVHEGGDHLIIVGYVDGITRTEGEALVFHEGQYSAAVHLELLAELKRGN